MVRVVGTSDLEQPKSLARAINVTRNTASTKIPASFDSDPIGCGRGELSHWFHGPQVSFTIFRTACSPQHLISGLGFRGTRAVRFLSLSLSLSLSFSGSPSVCNALSVAPVHYPIRSRSSEITLLYRTTDLWPLSRGFLLLPSYLSRPFPPRAQPPLYYSDVAVG